MVMEKGGGFSCIIVRIGILSVIPIIFG